MSEDDGDIFADSDDTAELMASKPAAKKTLGGAAKRKRNEGMGKKTPDADDGLFDSDDEDSKPAAKRTKPLSKKERMDALRKKKVTALRGVEEKMVNAVPERKPREGDDEEDSLDSREIHLTDADRDFIDTEGDEEGVSELYAEQDFGDRGEAEEDDMAGRKKNHKGGGGSRNSGSRKSEKLNPEADLDNPIMAAVYRMKKKKKEQKNLTEKEDECKQFIEKMERAAEEDESAIKERRPATIKLRMLGEVVDMLCKKDMMRVLLDLDVLSVCGRWIKPLATGSLGNVTVRQRLLDSISGMNGDNGITPNDLKKSEFGKVVMSLYMHRNETPAMKRQLKALIEQWSRPIFQKSGNMKDLERAHQERTAGGLSAISRQQMQESRQREQDSAKRPGGRTKDDLQHLIKSGKGKASSSLSRVRVPYSKGFQFTVRPSHRNMAKSPDKGGQGKGQEVRGNLAKRMVEKSRAVSKNQRSANISVEGRATK